MLSGLRLDSQPEAFSFVSSSPFTYSTSTVHLFVSTIHLFVSTVHLIAIDL
jgi:hypothetical protein